MTPPAAAPAAAPAAEAELRVEEPGDGVLRMIFKGEMTASSVDDIWAGALGRLRAPGLKRVVIDVAGVPSADGAGVGLLVDLERCAAERGLESEITGASKRLQQLIGLFDVQDLLKPPEAQEPELSTVEEIGRGSSRIWRDLHFQVSFIGELFAAFAAVLARPRKFRVRELMVTIERAGVDALPIVLLLGFLIGLIMAFQAAIPLKQFGAELYVADFVALVMVRELGALITALILIGRTGSAFAAEIGTMKINEELNALETLGLDPVRFLVVGRVMACIFVTPLLSLFAMLAGLIGGLVVAISLGFPAITYYKEALAVLDIQQFFAGLSKTLVFGFQIGAIGCMRGLQTRSGASAVGVSATRAVVTAIVVLVVTDGLFAVAFYYLDI